jgi:tetratricopeptide (TPR) repeat protein
VDPGVAYSHLGRLAEGEAELRESIRLDASYASAHYNLPRLLLRRGRIDEALETNESPRGVVIIAGSRTFEDRLNRRGDFGRPREPAKLP